MAEKPSHNVYVVEGEADNAFWTKVGGAWPLKNQDGFSIKINANIAVSGRLVVIARKDDKRDSNEG